MSTTIFSLNTMRPIARGVGVVAPPGCVAVPGLYDMERSGLVERADDFGGVLYSVEPTLPPRPPDSADRTWSWDDQVWGWVPSLTLAGHRARHRALLRATRNESLSASDGPAIAVLEEILKELAARLGLPIPAPAQSLLVLRKTLRDLPQRADFDLLTKDDVPRYSADGNGLV